MNKKLFFFAFLVALALALAVRKTVAEDRSCPGCPSQLSEEDKQSSTVKDSTTQGVDKIYADKAAANSLPNCVGLRGTLISGTKQVVAGIKLVLQVRVSPEVQTTENCRGVNADVSSVHEQNCEITAWIKPGNQGTEITYHCQ